MKVAFVAALAVLLIGAQAQDRKLLQAPASAPQGAAPEVAPSVAPSAGPSASPAVAPAAPPTVPPAVAPVPAAAPVPAPAPVVTPPAPAPAPVFVPIPAPAPAPVPAPVPAPAPAPIVPPPICAAPPACRLYLEDMLCCQQDGIVTGEDYAYLWVMCTDYVQLSPSCITATGPVNVTAYDVFNDDQQFARKFRFLVNWSNTTGFNGPITLDLEAARTTNPAQCSLAVSPCLVGSTLVNTTAPVQPISFNTVYTDDFADGFVGCPANDLSELDSFVWLNPNNSSQCLSSNIGELPPTFFQGNNFYNFTGGYQNVCNTTANLLSLGLPAPTASVSIASVG